MGNVTQKLSEAVGRVRVELDQYIVQNGPELVTNVVLAILILVVGLWFAKSMGRIVSRMLLRAKVDETLSKFLSRIAHVLLVLVVVVAALSKLDIETNSLTAVMAAAGLAIGLALQGSLSNFSSGVMIILFRPFSVGDFIEAGATTGIVDEVHIFSTILRTTDNVRIIVPNSAITSGNISNYSAEATRRVDLVIGCGYGDDLRAVKEYIHEVLQEEARILDEPSPVVAVHELADHSVNFVVRPWVRSEDYWSVRWDLLETLKNGFDERGFTIPFPQRDVHVRQSETRTSVSSSGNMLQHRIDPGSTGSLEASALRTPGQRSGPILPRRAAS